MGTCCPLPHTWGLPGSCELSAAKKEGSRPAGEGGLMRGRPSPPALPQSQPACQCGLESAFLPRRPCVQGSRQPKREENTHTHVTPPQSSQS